MQQASSRPEPDLGHSAGGALRDQNAPDLGFPKAASHGYGPGVIHNLQALRALAAFAVVFVHMDLFAKPLGIPGKWLAFGNAGVDIFFVLSGFLMVYTTQLKPVSGTQFALNRFIRVAPLYWLITLVVFGIALAMPGLLGATRPDWGELAKSLAFIPFQKSNGLVMPVLFVGWTLNYEMAFYLIFAAMLGVTGSRVQPTAYLSIAVIVLLVAVGLLFRLPAVELRFFTKQIMLEFAFGMIVALALARGGTVSPRIALPLLVISLAALGLGATVFEGWPRAVVSGLPATLVVLCTLWLDRSGWKLQNRHVAMLGDASYALYLTHPFALQGVGKLVPDGAPAAVVVAMLVGAVALAQAMAIAIHFAIEKPLTRKLRDGIRPIAARI